MHLIFLLQKENLKSLVCATLNLGKWYVCVAFNVYGNKRHIILRLKYITFVNRMDGCYQQFIKECTMLLQGK